MLKYVFSQKFLVTRVCDVCVVLCISLFSRYLQAFWREIKCLLFFLCLAAAGNWIFKLGH